MIASARVTLALGLGLALLPASARANPHPLPYSYPYQTLPKGKIEVEEIADLVPMRVAREKEDGTRDAVTALRSQLQTELEIGVHDRLELALYFSFHQSATADTRADRSFRRHGCRTATGRSRYHHLP